MKQFTKQLLFISISVAVLVVGGLVIYGATAGGNLKINPILGHDLDLDAKYYGQAANNTVHDITTQDISISAWVKVDGDAGNILTIINKRNDPTYLNGYSMWLLNGIIYYTFQDNSSNQYILYGNTNIRDNKWHYITGILDRDTATNCKVFLDGVEDGTTNKSGVVTSLGSLTSTYILGLGATNGGSFKLDGQIRDVKLYYAAGDHWSDAQVLYQAQHPFDYSANAGTMTDYWRLDEGSGTTLYGKVNNLTLSNVLAWTTQPKIKMVNQENATSSSNNPVGWWKMDEGTGLTTVDSSGNGNTGTLTGGPTWTTGKLGKGLSFDGVDDYVDAGTNATLLPDVFTVTGWVKTTATATNCFVSFRASYFPYIGVPSSASKAIIQLNTGNYRYFNNSPVNILNGSWHFVAFVVTGNGQTDINNSVMYADGQLQTVQGTVATDVPLTKTQFRIGRNGRETDTLPFNGSIDDVRIYNRALSAGEVSQMYNSTKDGYLGNIKVSTGLVGYWKLDDNNALTSVIDYSGKGNTGTAYSIDATSTSVLSTSTAMIGRAMSFDGVDDYVGVTNSSNLQSQAFTYGFWMYPIEANPEDYMGFSQLENYGVVIGSNSPNSYGNILFGNGTAWEIGGSLLSNVLTQFAWNHIVITRDANKLVKIYKNGAYVKQWQSTFTIVYPSGGLFTIGRSRYNRYFNGLIDEVKIWNYARSAKQIYNDYNKGLAGLP